MPQDVQTVDAEVRTAERYKAVKALCWFAVVFFLVLCTMTLVPAIRLGYGTGFGDGHLITDRLKPPTGHGVWGDTSRFVAMAALDLGLVAAWSWLGRRLGDDLGPPTQPAANPSSDEWYILDIPRITKVLMGVAILCVVAIVISAVVLFPLILIRYGW
jgi:hypothetical protein